jgi:hypothetical protein
MKPLQFLLVFLLLAGLGYLLWFHSLNRNYLAYPLPVIGALNGPAYFAPLVGFGLGLLYAFLLLLPSLVRRSWAARASARKISALEQENQRLKLALARPMLNQQREVASTATVTGIPDRNLGSIGLNEDEPMSDFPGFERKGPQSDANKITVDKKR